MTKTSTKRDVRTDALARRGAIADDARAAFARRLALVGPRIVHDFAPRQGPLVVALFHAIGSEPDLTPLAHALVAAGIALALPITGARNEALVFRGWTPGEPTVIGQLGIAEPPATAALVEPDVLFVPLAAFDRRGHRIGYGAGHYDRSLADLRARKAIRAIGVGYAEQEVLYIPDEPHDEALDLIVTDRDTILCDR